MSEQAISLNLSDAQVSQIITNQGETVDARFYELLPQTLKQQDQEGIVKGFFEAIESEYERHKKSIGGIVGIISPQDVNRSYILSGNPVFFHPEQFVLGASAGSPAALDFSGSVSGVSGSGYYRDFGVFVWSDETTPTSVGQYRKVISYDGTTKMAELDYDWDVLPSERAIYALCWPDRIWLPCAIVSDPREANATLLPRQILDNTFLTGLGIDNRDIQTGKVVLLPGLSYLATYNNYYVGWTLDFLDGNNEGTSIPIKNYYCNSGSYVVVLEKSVSGLKKNDWFRLTPPKTNSISISDDYYKGRWLYIGYPTSNDITYKGRVKPQVRRILRSTYDPLATPSSHVAYIYDAKTGEGEQFTHPPAPTFDYGILTSYIPLQHLAAYVGIEIDEEDNELYQREQISQAYNFHRLKGTRRAIELAARSFGLEVTIDEAGCNFVPAPDNDATELSAVERRAHKQYSNAEITPHVKYGKGFDDVPISYLTSPGNLAARIPDSDIRIFLSRTELSKDTFNVNVFERVVRRISPHIPVHVQIIFIGLLTKAVENIDVEELMTCEIRPLAIEEIEITETFVGTPLGTVPTLDAYTVVVQPSVAIVSQARYSRSTSRFGQNGNIPATSRWSRGSVAFLDD